MTDIDYNEIDPGIRHVVKALNDAGYETTDSGDGTKVGMDCAMDFPHVAGAWSAMFAMFANREALEGAADYIARTATEIDGKPWKCDVGYDSLSKQWTWITYPLDDAAPSHVAPVGTEHIIDEHDSCWCVPGHVCAECRAIGPWERWRLLQIQTVASGASPAETSCAISCGPMTAPLRPRGRRLRLDDDPHLRKLRPRLLSALPRDPSASP